MTTSEFFRRATKTAVAVVAVLAVLLALAALSVRFIAQPYVEAHPAKIADFLSRQSAQPISMGAIAVGWHGLNPELRIKDLKILAKGKGASPALDLPRVRMQISWRSLFAGHFRFRKLRIESPTLVLRRDADNHFYVAGFPIAMSTSDDSSEQANNFTDWLRHQADIEIVNGTVLWNDERRHAPPLIARHVIFSATRSFGGAYRLYLSATLDAGRPTNFELSGERKPGFHPFIHDGWHWFAQFKNADYRALAQWFDLPFSVSDGEGSTVFTADMQDGSLKAFSTDISLKNAVLDLVPERHGAETSFPKLQVRSANGHFTGRKTSFIDRDDGQRHALYSVSTRNFTFVSGNGTVFPPTALTASVETPFTKDNSIADWISAFDRAGRIRIGFQSIPLKPVRELLAGFPWQKASPEFEKWLKHSEVDGTLEDGSFVYTPATDYLPFSFQAQTRLSDVSSLAMDAIPGFAHLTGVLRFDNHDGSFDFDSRGATLDAPKLFAEKIPFDSIDGSLSWRLSGQALTYFSASKFHVVNDDVDFTLDGDWRATSGHGIANLTGRIENAQAPAAYRYVPVLISKNVRDWLRDALVAGVASHGVFTLKGALSDFPFDRQFPPGGLFQITGDVANGRLRFQPDWPPVENLSARLNFKNGGMLIESASKDLKNAPTISGASIASATVSIPELNSRHPRLDISGKVSGDATTYLKFLDDSPVGKMIGGALEGAHASGGLALALNLDIPMSDDDPAAPKINGKLTPSKVNLALDGAPALTKLEGDIDFTQNGLSAKQVKFNALGHPATAVISDSGGATRFVGKGSANIDDLKSFLGYPSVNYASGTANWNLEIVSNGKNGAKAKEPTSVQPNKSVSTPASGYSWTLVSPLAGVSSTLPYPFDKVSNLTLARSVSGNTDLWSASLQADGTPVHVLAQGALKDDKGGKVWRLARAAVELSNNEPSLPKDESVAVYGELPHLDVQSWIDRFSGELNQFGKAPGDNPLGLPVAIGVSIGEFNVASQVYHDARIQARTSNTGSPLCAKEPGACWRADVDASELAGTLEWENSEASGTPNGRLNGALTQLTLHALSKNQEELATQQPSTVMSWPQISLKIQHVIYAGNDIGGVSLDAKEQDSAWHIENMTLANSDGKVSLSGNWQPSSGTNVTAVQIDAGIKDVAGFLKRFKAPQAIVASDAKLKGTLSWKSVPSDFDLKTLNGEMSVDVGSGRFLKIEPGIGRLLSVFSLQSLPKRIILDFRDVFSDGFAFDKISGKTTIQNGVISFKNLEMDGSAAAVKISGNVDLVNETQKLDVKVRPAFSSTLSVGAGVGFGLSLANPLTGIATGLGLLIGQTVFSDPVGKMFSYEYSVDGTWSDPKVQKKNTRPTSTVGDAPGEGGFNANGM